MPEYLSPGVYVEEIEIGSKPIEGVGTSTAGFLGQTELGPTAPRLITSPVQFNRIYGGFIDQSFLAYAVDGFFRNGGQRCFVARIVRVKDDDSTLNAQTIQTPSSTILVKAIGPGSWATRVALKISDASLNLPEDAEGPDPNADLFKLTVMYWNRVPPQPVVDPTDRTNRNDPNRREPTFLEVYDNLSPDDESPDYFKNKVNGISNLIELDFVEDQEGRPANADLVMLADPNDNPEQWDGSDITAADYVGEERDIDVDGEPATERTGLTGFEHIDEINMVCAPDESNHDGLSDLIVDHCEEPDLYRFAILQSARDDVPSKIGGDLRPPRDSKYAAFYYPWIKILDPRTNRDKLIPPGGHIAGIYARSDIERGVFKAPANEIVRGVRALQFSIGKGQQDILNPIGVNVIRSFPGRGIRVWGARTTSSDPLWKYINVRRLFLFLEESIDEGTQWVVFEPNNEQLWARVRQTIVAFLTTVWRTGALMGTTPDEAFFVKVDRSTMTQDDIDNGRLIVLIGVAPTKPAEFVIFRIAQFTAGAENA